MTTPTIFTAPVTERHVQALWYDHALRPDGLETSCGQSVRVIDPGVWNLEAGPDFRNAVIEYGHSRTRLCGDVEIHIHPADWTAHNHAHDPAYAHVVAHVTWYPETPATRPALPANCLRICLGDRLRADPAFSPDEIDLDAYPYARLPATPRPCETRFATPPDRALTILRAAGRRRLTLKTRRFKTLFLRRQDRLQVFYEEFLGAFGYKYNAFSFRELARLFPWTELPRGFEEIRSALTCAADMAVAQTAPWRRANVRPVNSPHRRIAAAAALFADGLPTLLERLTACDLAERAGQKAALAVLEASRYLGPHRAAAILANVLVPFARAEERLSEIPDWLYPEDVCAPMRLTAHRLFGRDHNPALYAGNGLYLQGLLQIHKDFCLAVHPDCSVCPLVR